MTPNSEQQAAIDQMVAYCLAPPQGFFILEGPAGTGKTFSMRQLVNQYRGRALFTAPTNKAVRVLREALADDDYRPECKTIYSALGLQMLATGEVKELSKSDEKVDLSMYRLVVVDEASMVSTQLMQYIEQAAADHPTLHWIFMGDPYQLPPVGEPTSVVWKLPNGARLKKIMRQDNQILKLSAHLRGMVDKPFSTLNLASDNDGVEGIWVTPAAVMEARMLERADTFLKGESKAIAWRNIEVNRLNQAIRAKLFADGGKYPWQPGDRITLLEPATEQATNTDKKRIIGITDEEGAVERADLAQHPVFKEFECWRVQMRSDFNSSLTLWVPTPHTAVKLEFRAARMAAEARASSKWREFWEFKEAFHKVRHAYAITAHRAQGSTYQRAFVSWRDILLNRNRAEALRCLYVAATRPKKELHLG